MRSPAAAIAWEFRQRHRWGLIVLLLYVVALAAARVVFRPIRFESEEAFAFSVLVPLAAAFLYFLAVFSFGLRGDIASRESMYPARMFALPVKTAALAWWPMLYGTVAMAVLWFLLRFVGIWPPEAEVPKWWPAMLAASILAWTQALTWMAYPLRGLRVIVSVLVLTMIDVVVFTALQFRPPESLMFAILAPTIPVAYFVALSALSRARRGDVPEWRLRFAGSAKRVLEPFASAQSAQLWFEWRRFGRVLPALVGILLPCELGMLALFRETESIVFTILLGVLLTPLFMAMFVAASVRNVYSFETTRPLDNLQLIGAKLNAALWSTVATWALVLAAIPVALRWSGTWNLVANRARVLSAISGGPRSTAVVVLAIAILMASTWKQLVQSLSAEARYFSSTRMR